MGRSQPATALLAQAVTQQTQSYCGVASSVAALNALGASPAPELHPGYAYWTQEDAFQYLGLVSCTLATWVPAEKVGRSKSVGPQPSDFGTAGLSLAEMRSFVAQRLPAETHYAESATVDSFRADVIAATIVGRGNGTRSVVICNFDRAAVAQAGG